MTEFKHARCYGEIPKSKYRLYINGQLSYFFVTTTRGEKECIEILKGIANDHQNVSSKAYYITKTTGGITAIIYKGRIAGLYTQLKSKKKQLQ